MVEQILQIIYDSGLYSKSQIARELNISEEIVEDVFFRLVRSGYLEEDESKSNCSHSCTTCPFTRCDKDIIQGYNITEKGMSIINS